MSQVELAGVTRRFGDVQALAGADLAVEAGELVAVLGPSGCGKTTLLRLVAGFDRPDSGVIRIGGRDVDGPGVRSVPVHRRGVAVVPQEGALFPHLSVAENVGFGLGRSGTAGRIAEVLDLVGLAGYERRYPHELSGGQQQRVAVARALAPRPSVVLLDEPFSALDAALRVGMRTDIRAALAHDGATALLVTHDQGEALSISDRVAVMNAGRILQVDRPDAVYRRPADSWVAGFVGEGTEVAGRATGDGLLDTPLGVLRPAAPVAAGECRVLVRPEQVVLGDSGLPAVIESVTYHGHDSLVTLRTDSGLSLRARILADDTPPQVGARTGVRVEGDVHTWPHPR